VFYVLSKILDVLLTPIAWVTLLVAWGVLTKRGVWARRALVLGGLAVLLFFSLEPVSNALVRSLETPTLDTMKPDVSYDVVILLGGVADERAQVTWGQRAFNDNNERLLETFDLLRGGKARYAIVSGGAANPEAGAVVEARILADQLIAWGIDPSRVVVEDRARNTHENAVYAAAIVRDRGWKTVLMLTSAFHARRAYGCFVAEGLPVDVKPVDFRSYAAPFRGELIPRADHLEQSSLALREWFGRKVYNLRGYAR
jgi:uncharacterized SAM-binding protein YcdF (DUF218 family)